MYETMMDEAGAGRTPKTLALDDQAFERLLAPLRAELKLYCYRMLGSLQEAEDAVQEAYLKAWRARAQFEGPASPRAWLFRIATNACLDILRRRGNRRRVLIEAGTPATTQLPSGPWPEDGLWLDPYPDSELHEVADAAPGPHARIEARESVRLAFVAAIQQLPPRQRAVLLLRDVLGWTTEETAGLIGGTKVAVNSALQRARAVLARQDRSDPAPRMLAHGEADLLARYMAAWNDPDPSRLVSLLRDDATFVMPPRSQWYSGATAIGGFFAATRPHYGAFRLLPARANGQPAFAMYTRDDVAGLWRAHCLHVLETDGERVTSIVMFLGALGRDLLPRFGLPLEWA